MYDSESMRPEFPVQAPAPEVDEAPRRIPQAAPSIEEEAGVQASSAAAEQSPLIGEAPPRDWDRLTSRGFLGLKWLFNWNGARTKRNQEKAERRQALRDAWSNRNDPSYSAAPGIRESRYGQSKWRDLLDIERKFKWGRAMRSELGPNEQSNPVAAQSHADAADESAPVAESARDDQWRAWAGLDQAKSTPNHRAAAPTRSAMKTGATLAPLRSDASRSSTALGIQEDYEQSFEAEAAAREAMLQARPSDGPLAKVDASMKGTLGKSRTTGVSGAGRANPLLTGQLLFGAQSVDAGDAATGRQANTLSAPYRTTMDTNYGYEKALQTLAGPETRDAQRDLAFPHELYPLPLPGPGETQAELTARMGQAKKDRLNFFNGYWRQPIADSRVEQSPRAGRRVGFTSGGDDFEASMNKPGAALDPAAEGAANRVLPTSVHRYVNESGDTAGNATLQNPESDADALRRSLANTEYNRRVFSDKPKSHEAAAKSAGDHAMDYQEFGANEVGRWARSMMARTKKQQKASKPEQFDEESIPFRAGRNYYGFRNAQ